MFRRVPCSPRAAAGRPALPPAAGGGGGRVSARFGAQGIDAGTGSPAGDSAIGRFSKAALRGRLVFMMVVAINLSLLISLQCIGDISHCTLRNVVSSLCLMINY